MSRCSASNWTGSSGRLTLPQATFDSLDGSRTTTLSFGVRTKARRKPSGGGRRAGPGAAPRPAAPPLAGDSLLAVEIRGLLEHGEIDAARQRFGALVEIHQRRGTRIAYQYLRDGAD